MNRTIKTYFNLFAFFFGISLLFVNCEKDFNIQELETTIDSEFDFKVYRIGKEKIQENNSVFNKLPSIKQQILRSQNNNINSYQRSTFSNQYDFTIEVDYASYVESNDGLYHSYTFPITRTESNGLLENLLLSLQEDGTYRAFLCTYNVTGQELINIGNNIYVDLTNKVTFIELDADYIAGALQGFDAQFCYFDSEEICVEIPCSIDECMEPEYTTQDCNTFAILVCEEGQTGGEYYPNDPDYEAGSNDYGAGTIGSGGAFIPITNPINTDMVNWRKFVDGLDRDLANIMNTLPLPPYYLGVQEYLIINNFSIEAEAFAELALEILTTPFPTTLTTTNQYKEEILRMINHLRGFGNPEDHIFADYVESFLPDLNSMTIGENSDLAYLTYQQTQMLTIKYLESVTIPFAEAAYPFVIYAITEVTLGAALPLLSRIPLAMVIRGARLNKMVKQLSKIGNQGSTQFIREIPNSSAQKATKLFQKITQNRIGTIETIVTPNGNILRANMGNGNYITYREFATQSPNTLATIELNFSNLFDDLIKLKFNN